MPREHLVFKDLRNATKVMALQISKGIVFQRAHIITETESFLSPSKRHWLMERAGSNAQSTGHNGQKLSWRVDSENNLTPITRSYMDSILNFT